MSRPSLSAPMFEFPLGVVWLFPTRMMFTRGPYEEGPGLIAGQSTTYFIPYDTIDSIDVLAKESEGVFSVVVYYKGKIRYLSQFRCECSREERHSPEHTCLIRHKEAADLTYRMLEQMRVLMFEWGS